MIDDFGQSLPALDQVALGQLTLEDAVLKMVTIGLHDFEDFAETFIVGNVVTNNVS